MANEVLLKVAGVPKQISFAVHAELNAGANNVLEIGGQTEVEMDMDAVVAGAYENSDQFDFGALRAARYSVMSAIEFSTAPAAGGTINYWLAPSDLSGAAVGNPGGADGTDAAYQGYGADAAAADEAVGQLLYLGSMVVVNDGGDAVQIAWVGTFAPPARYGQLIIKNSTNQTTITDAVEQNTVFTPITDEIQ